MTKEVLKLALEALIEVKDANIHGLTLTQDYHEAITAIKAALEAKDEPVTENGMYRLGYHNGYGFGEAYGKANAPQRTWVGLTDDEIVLIVAECAASHQHTDIHFARAIEAKLKERNT
jgi:hypothetical protein